MTDKKVDKKSESSSKAKNPVAFETKDYEKIGRTFENVVMHGYANKKRLFGMNFLRGLFFGFGSTVGATLLILVIIYTLSLFSELPLIGNLFESVQTTIEGNVEP